MAKTPQTPDQPRPKLVSKKIPLIMRSRITQVETQKFKDVPVSGVEIGVDFENVLANGPNLEIWFMYQAVFQEGVGTIVMRGFLLIEMGEKRAERVVHEWNNNKAMSEYYVRNFLQFINYKCGTEAILAAKLVELPSPIIPPPIGVVDGEQDAPRAQAGAPAPPHQQQQQQPAAKSSASPDAAKPPAQKQPPAQPAFNPPTFNPPTPSALDIPPARAGTRTIPIFQSPFANKKPN